jgi:RimJ/RimL family protein N-acetyltransferase
MKRSSAVKSHRSATSLKPDASGIFFLKGKKVTLRPVSEKDIPLFLRWFNDPEVRQFVTTIFPVTEKSEQEWVESLGKKSDKDVVLVIEVKGRPIGTMGLHRINWQDRTATTGAVIGEKSFWGKGYGTDAKMTLLNYAFNTLNLRKIISMTLGFNGRSKRYSEKCGYREEARLKAQHFKNGQYWDEIILALFKEEWLPFWRKYCKKNDRKK